MNTIKRETCSFITECTPTKLVLYTAVQTAFCLYSPLLWCLNALLFCLCQIYRSHLDRLRFLFPLDKKQQEDSFLTLPCQNQQNETKQRFIFIFRTHQNGQWKRYAILSTSFAFVLAPIQIFVYLLCCLFNYSLLPLFRYFSILSAINLIISIVALVSEIRTKEQHEDQQKESAELIEKTKESIIRTMNGKETENVEILFYFTTS